MLAVGVQRPEAGSYTSALASAEELSLEALPPTTRTCPFASRAAPWPQRARFRLPVPRQVSPPTTDAGEPVADGDRGDSEAPEPEPGVANAAG